MCCSRKKRADNREALADQQGRGGGEDHPLLDTPQPIGAKLNEFPPAPSEKSPCGKYDIAQLHPGDSLVMPTSGKGALKRVFLGIGWKSDSRIDVDCVCAPFSQGVRGEADTVWWRNTKSTAKKSGSFAMKGSVVDIKHTGDVLTPQQGTHELEDLERIYVDLEHLDPKYDALGFEANVFSQGMSFANLSSAYVRLVNADTNQEIMRCALDSSSGKSTYS